MVEACLCDKGTRCERALGFGFRVVRFVIVAAVRGKCAMKDRALL